MNDTTEETAPEFTGQATYSPEDNKLRLYVGRVPRDEYLKLRAEGWTSTPKQSCDFVATWTPERRDTALDYAGIIEDEDQGPAERAADRAERFGGYRDKRTDEANGRADSYDAGPSVHGYQSQARAERSAARHDRIASRACDAWSKAEYWQRRTAGVISHALYKSLPGVRMGRIKTLEAELRKLRASIEDSRRNWRNWCKLRAIEDAASRAKNVFDYVGSTNQWADYKHPRAEGHPNEYRSKNAVSLYSLMTDAFDPVSADEILTLYFSDHAEPQEETDWTQHLTLRLAYENQMLAAEGGRAAFVEMEAGGWIGKHQIRKVNKSPATGRVVSVTLKIPGDRWGNSQEGFHMRAFNIERLSVDSYKPPTAEDRASLHETKSAEKAAAPKKPACPLVNPTDKDAERLQAIFNAQRDTRWNKEPATVERITQAVYSANSGGVVETVEITGGGFVKSSHYMSDRNADFPTVAKVRVHGQRVLILSDKPQKPFPAQVWHDPRPAVRAECVKRGDELREAMRARSSGDWTKEQRALVDLARSVGLVRWSSTSQFNLTPAGLDATGFKQTANA